MPRGGARARSGRKRGPGKAKREALERERISAQLAETPEGAAAKAAQAGTSTDMRAVSRGRKLAKERLEDLLEIATGMAGYYQRPLNPNAPPNPNANQAEFEKWFRLAMQCSALAAPYQSPTFRAIVVAPAPDTNQPEQRRRFTLSIFDNPRQSLDQPDVEIQSAPASVKQH